MKGHTAKGSAKKGFRVTHPKRAIPKRAGSDRPVPGGTANGGMGKGGANVRGNAGNATKPI